MKGYLKIFSLESFQIFVFVYAFLKYAEAQKCKPKHRNDKTNKLISFLKFILRILLTIIISILSFILLFIFATYYEIINIILRYSHGENFVGLLEGTDIVYALEDQTRSIINLVCVIELKEHESVQDLYLFMSKKYKEMSDTHPKMSCTRARDYGYAYFLKADIDISEFVTYLDDYENEEELQVILDKYSNSPMPINDTALWKIYIGKTPISWSVSTKNQHSKKYPLMIVYHHCLGDGVSIISMMSINLLERGVDIIKEKCVNLEQAMKRCKALTDKPMGVNNICSRIDSFVRDIFSKEMYLKFVGLLTRPEVNVLHGQRLSGKKHLVWALENEGDNYVNKVKAIKKCFPGTSFSDVVMVAISASFSEYFHKHQRLPPKTVRTSVTAFVTSANFNKLVTYDNGYSVAKLSNNFSIGMIDMPIADEDIKHNLLNRLRQLSKDSKILRNSLDYQFIYWQLKVVSTLLPIPILKLSVDSNDYTVLVTNVPGNADNILLNGNVILDSIIWAPNYRKTGCSVSIFSYNGLFRISCITDKTLIENREEVQLLMDRVFYYITLLSEATSDMQKTKALILI